MPGDPIQVYEEPKPEPVQHLKAPPPTVAERLAYQQEETIMARQGTVLVLLFAGIGVMVGVKMYRKRVI